MEDAERKRTEEIMSRDLGLIVQQGWPNTLSFVTGFIPGNTYCLVKHKNAKDQYMLMLRSDYSRTPPDTYDVCVEISVHRA